MALPTQTEDLDTPSRGLPVDGIWNLSTGPNVDTQTLDTPSRGLPFLWIKAANTAAAAVRRYRMLMGFGS